MRTILRAVICTFRRFHLRLCAYSLSVLRFFHFNIHPLHFASCHCQPFPLRGQPDFFFFVMNCYLSQITVKCIIRMFKTFLHTFLRSPIILVTFRLVYSNTLMFLFNFRTINFIEVQFSAI